MTLKSQPTTDPSDYGFSNGKRLTRLQRKLAYIRREAERAVLLPPLVLPLMKKPKKLPYLGGGPHWDKYTANPMSRTHLRVDGCGQVRTNKYS